MFKKLSTAAGLLLISASMVACGGNNVDTPETCEDGQLNVAADVANGDGEVLIPKGCYDTCANDSECGSTEACVTTSQGGVCVGGASANNTDPNNMNANSTSNNSTSNNSTSNNTVPNGNPNNTVPNGNPNNTVPNGNPNNTVPNGNPNGNPNTGTGIADAGAVCGSDADCDDICILDDSFPQGYCTSLGCSEGDCGTNGTCLDIGDGNTACFASCAIGGTDCRDGYTCQDDGGGGGVCAPEPAAVGSACDDDADCSGAQCLGVGDGYCTGGCEDDAGCPDGNICSLFGEFGENIGICTPECSSDADCRDGLLCVDTDGNGSTECFAPVAFGPGATGDACTDTPDCSGGVNGICLNDEVFGGMGPWEDNYCSRFCEIAVNDCDEGAHCSSFFDVGNPDFGLCVATCTTTADCPNGQFCGDADNDGANECWFQEITPPCEDDSGCDMGENCALIGQAGGTATQGVCLENCTMDADCSTMGDRCVDTDGNSSTECVPAFADGTGVVGDACASTNDCSGGIDGFCFEEDMGAFPAGYCSENCEDDMMCPGGSTCQTFSTGENTTISFCTADCDANNPCSRTGYECLDPMNLMTTTGAGFCFDPNVFMAAP